MESYYNGNNYVSQGQFENAIMEYSQTIRSCTDDVVLVKTQANRGFCHYKLRNYLDAVDDYNSVVEKLSGDFIQMASIEQKKMLCKTLIRRAMCFEYMAEFSRAMEDIERASSLDQHIYSDKIVTGLISRLVSSLKSDKRAARAEPRPDYLITSQQTLRLIFLMEPPSVIKEGELVRIKLCIGNEFGLFDRLFYGERSNKLQLSFDEASQPIETPRSDLVLANISCEAIPLHGSSRVTVSSPSNPLLHFDVGKDGRASFEVFLNGESPKSSFILRFFVLEHKLTVASGKIVDVYSLPLSISTENGRRSSEFAELTSVAERIGANCIRGVKSSHGDTVYVLESAGQLGIGGKVWDSSYVLARYIDAYSDSLVKGKKVIELGSGTGISGRE